MMARHWERHIMMWLFMGVAICVAACAGLRLEPPRAQLAALRLQTVQGLETVWQVQLRVLNPNDVPLAVKGLECELLVNEREFAYGVSDSGVEVPAYGAAVISVDLYSSVVHLFRGMVRLRDRETLTYAIRGQLHLSGGGAWPGSLPFQVAGELKTEDFLPPDGGEDRP